MRPMDPAPIDAHHHLFAGFAADRHHLVALLTQLLGIKVWHDFREDLRSPILDGADDTEQHAAGDATPGVLLPPRLPFAAFFLFALPLAQRAYGQAIPLDAMSPAQLGQGTAPHDRFVFIE